MKPGTLPSEERTHSLPEDQQETPIPCPFCAKGATELSAKEQKQLRLALIQAEAPALYSDNNSRVTQRNYILLGIFIVFSPMLSLAMQGGKEHHYALTYNIIIFFIMLLFMGNTEKMGRQNGEILGIEKRAKYCGIQTQRAIRRQEQQVITVPQWIVSPTGISTIVVPSFFAIRWGKQYWGTMGLVLSTDCIMLFLSGLEWDPLSIMAVLFTVAIPICITHERPMEKPSGAKVEAREVNTYEQ